MTGLDKLLRRWRTGKAMKHVRPGSCVLDIGTFDGELFRLARVRGVGIDPMLTGADQLPDRVTLVRGGFPEDMPGVADGTFDTATALAVVEHVQRPELERWAKELARLVKPGGRVVITVPAPAVDQILHVLMRLRLVDGMEAHQHHGFVPDDLLGVFAAPDWRLAKRATFQLRLNNLYVFERQPAGS